jgi:hypothetical protein
MSGRPTIRPERPVNPKGDFRGYPLEIAEEIIFIRQLLEACGSADLMSLLAILRSMRFGGVPRGSPSKDLLPFEGPSAAGQVAAQP